MTTQTPPATRPATPVAAVAPTSAPVSTVRLARRTPHPDQRQLGVELRKMFDTRAGFLVDGQRR